MIIEISITEIISVLLNCWRYLSVVLSVQTILVFFLENLFNLHISGYFVQQCLCSCNTYFKKSFVTMFCSMVIKMCKIFQGVCANFGSKSNQN